jgi:uncharacterized protein (DUF2141 family)
MPRLLSALVASFLAVAPAALAAVPVPPDQIAYSGYVAGAPSPQQIVARIYDAASGGTLLYRQAFTSVPLDDGHFTVHIGPTGTSFGPPPPLTTSLRTALTGDLAAAAGRFLEITVNSVPLPRVQLVLVPYAMRADHATTSDVATQALDTEAVVGLDGVALQALFEVYNDDGGPPSDDPREGTGDADGDGAVNFVDPDNDNDTLSDSAEVAQGSDINLVTPTVGPLTPSIGESDSVTPVTVAGTGFLPGLSAELGGQVLSPFNVTSTSFQANVGPHPIGPVGLTVTNPNGQVGTRPSAFVFLHTVPSITRVTPNGGPGDEVTTVTVTGTGFLPGLTAQLDSQTLTVVNLTATSFQADAGPVPGPYPVVSDLTVTNTNGASDTLDAAFTFRQPGGVAAIPLPFPLTANQPVAIVAQGEEMLVYGKQSNGQNRYVMDTTDDADISFDVDRSFNGRTPTALSWSPSRVLHGLRVLASTNAIQVVRDSNGDHYLGNAESLPLESPGTTAYTRSPSLLFDAAGRPGGGYLRVSGSTSTAMAFHDRDGNGAFTGTNEVVVIEAVGGATNHLGDAGFDASGGLAYVYYDSVNAAVRVAHDRSGDGDFDDSPGGLPEVATAVTTAAAPACLDMAFDGAGRLAIVHVTSGVSSLLHDRNGDADFLDAGESQTLPLGGATGCDVGTSALTGRLVIVHNPGDTLHLLVDQNDDGDFADPVEVSSLAFPIGAPLAVATTATGSVRVLAPQGVVPGPVR